MYFSITLKNKNTIIKKNNKNNKMDYNHIAKNVLSLIYLCMCRHFLCGVLRVKEN